MTAHELARKLLEGPDLQIVIDDADAWIEISHVGTIRLPKPDRPFLGDETVEAIAIFQG